MCPWHHQRATLCFSSLQNAHRTSPLLSGIPEQSAGPSVSSPTPGEGAVGFGWCWVGSLPTVGTGPGLVQPRKPGQVLLPAPSVPSPRPCPAQASCWGVRESPAPASTHSPRADNHNGTVRSLGTPPIRALSPISPNTVLPTALDRDAQRPPRLGPQEGGGVWECRARRQLSLTGPEPRVHREWTAGRGPRVAGIGHVYFLGRELRGLGSSHRSLPAFVPQVPVCHFQKSTFQNSSQQG